MAELNDSFDVGGCIVLVGRCPPGHYFGYGIEAIATNVSSHDHETCPNAILHLFELFKGAVCWYIHLSQPYVSDTYVQGIVVPNATGLYLCHCCFYITDAAPAPERAATMMRATSKSTLHQLTFFIANYRGKFLNIVVQAEDGASEQESLRDIHQGSASDIINVEDLDISKRDAADN